MSNHSYADQMADLPHQENESEDYKLGHRLAAKTKHYTNLETR